MNIRLAFAAAAVYLLAAVFPLSAHHSFAAEYDSSKPVEFKGVVTKLDWMNPHVYFYVDVKDKEGKTVNWACEAGNPNALARRGWKKSSLKAGDEVTVSGFRAKDGTLTANARSIVLTDGTKLFAGSSDDGGPAGGPLN
jgi:hypothetical protein